MRDPARIHRMLQKVRAAWLLNPDMRLGQMLVNLQWTNEDLYFIEDDVIEERLEQLFMNIQPRITPG